MERLAGMCFCIVVIFHQQLIVGTASLSDLVRYDATKKYGIILDGGSTGTKLNIFSWKPRLSRDELPKNVTELYVRKFSPSIDSFTTKLGDLDEYLSTMVRHAMELLPQDIHSQTPIYLLTTAGVRFLDGTLSQAVVDKVRTILMQKSINPFLFQPRFARVTSGEEEGAYAWIAVNYMQGLLGPQTKPSDRVGILEMGGGSTQIAFQPSVPLYANKYNIQLVGRPYGIYSHSYLNYGAHYMQIRINHWVSRVNSGYDSINPCILTGDAANITHNGTDTVVRGGGDWQKCQRILQQFLQRSNDDMCYPKPCAIGSVYQPIIGNKKFIATQVFFFTSRDLFGAANMKGRLDINALRDKARSHCQKTLQMAKETMKTKEKYLSQACMMGVYIPLLLTKAYGFPSGTNNIVFDEKVQSWGLGAMVREIQYLDVGTSSAEAVESLSSLFVVFVASTVSHVWLRLQ